MRRFLSKVLLYAAAAFALAAVMDYTVCTGLLKMEDYRFQDFAAMLKGGMDHDVLIMGNSRGKHHYDPQIIDSTLNVSSFCIGIGGYPINVEVEKYDLYRSHNTKPRVILQNIDYLTMNVMEDVRHQHQSEMFFPLVYDRAGRKMMRNLGYGFAELNIPFYRMYGYQQGIKNGILEAAGLKHCVSRPAYKGHRAEEGKWNGHELNQMAVHRAEISAESKIVLEQFLSQCRKDSIDVILVNSPMYCGVKKKVSNLDEIKTYFDNTARRYGFRYLDYSVDCPIAQDSSNFCVAVHMNPTATKEFTRTLCKDLESVLK